MTLFATSKGKTMKPHFLLLFTILLFIFDHHEASSRNLNSTTKQPNKLLGHNRCSDSFIRTTTMELNRRRSVHRAANFHLDEDYESPMREWAQEFAEYKAGLRDEPPPRSPYSYIWREFDPSKGEGQPYAIVEWLYRDGGFSLYHWYGEEPPTELYDRYVAFTNMVWAGSSSVAFGCADARWEPNDSRYLVAAISPAGSWPGGFALNVRPPVGGELEEGGKIKGGGGGGGGAGKNRTVLEARK